MIKVIGLICIFLLVSFDNKAKEPERFSTNFIAISYLGENLVHPGLQFGLFKSVLINKDSNSNRNRFDFGVSTSSYYHSKNHIGIRITPSFSVIHATKRDFEYGIKTDFGLMRRFYQGKVFEVDNNGNVNQKYFAGQNSFNYGFYLVFAKSGFNCNSKNYRLFAELGGFVESNFNDNSLIHPTLNIGFCKYLKLNK